jgi:alkylation response protein AidB-like acyl-CoA dehydrogenase
MNFELSEEQQLLQETFARFLNEESTMDGVRAALPSGFDQALWAGLAELGAFSLRVPQAAGGLGLEARRRIPRGRRFMVARARSIGA